MTPGRAGHENDPRSIDDVRTAVEFAAVLSELRRASGRSLRSLSDAISAASTNGDVLHASYSTLGEWCRGDRLPQLTHLAAFERLLIELGVTDTTRWFEVLAQVRERSSRSHDDRVPYKGLDSFSGDDREWFFGRSELIDDLSAEIRSVAASDDLKMVWVLGASGSGKSSLLAAGVIPSLADDGWHTVTMTPGRDPSVRLADAMSDAPERGQRLLVVDAFEEVFTEASAEEGAAFTERIVEVARDRVVVCAMRIAYFGRVAESTVLGQTLTDSQLLLRPMSEDEIREAITGPATLAGGSVDDDLVEVLVREIVPTDRPDRSLSPGALPLLSYALAETWKLRRRGHMTVADYFAVGGLGGAIDEAADDAYESLDEPRRALAEHVFLRLVHVDDDTVARHHARLDELVGLDDDFDTPDAVLDAMRPFVDARLVTVDEGSIRITHEVVLSAWPRLREWVDTHRAALTQRRSIAIATRQWLEVDRDPSALARGTRLDVMGLVEAAAPEIGLSRDERRFLAESRAAAVTEARSTRRQNRTLRIATGVAATLAVAAAVLAFVATGSRQDALDSRRDALSRQIAITAQGLVDRDLSLAQQLAVSAYEVAPTAEARATLLDVGAMPRPARYLGGAGSTAVTTAPSGDWFALTDNVDATVQLFERDQPGYRRVGVIEVGEPGTEVYALAAGGDDESLLAVGDTTATVTMWDVSDLDAPVELAELDGPSGPVQSLAIKPDGTTLVVAGATSLWQSDQGDDTTAVDAVLRWDISDPSAPEPLPSLPMATEVTWSVAYNDDGSLLAVGDEDGHMSLWRTGDEPELVSDVTVGDRSTVAVAMSGDRVAAGTRTAELGVWDISDPSAPSEIDIDQPDFSTWVNAVGFSPDGDHFVAGGSDAVVQVWDTEDWGHETTFVHPDPVTQMWFGDDGTLFTGAVDGSARLWDLAAAVPKRMLGIVGDVSFSADGSLAAALSGWDAAVWDTSVDDGVLQSVFHEVGDDLVIGSGSISPDGSMLAYGTIDGTVRLYDLDDANPAAVDLPVGDASGVVQSAAFSADSDVLAAGTDDGRVRLWDVSDVDDPSLVSTLDDASQIVLQVGWSRSGRTLASASAEGTVFLYDVDDPTEPRLLGTIDVLESEAYTVAFSPDGTTLALAGTESDVWLVDVSDPSDPVPLGEPIRTPSSRVYDLAFDADGSRLAAGVTDGTVWLWDTTDPADVEHVATLGPRDDAVLTVAFHPTQDRLLASGIDPTVLYWDLDVDRVIENICRDTGDIITEAEWAQHLPSEPYDPPCD